MKVAESPDSGSEIWLQRRSIRGIISCTGVEVNFIWRMFMQTLWEYLGLKESACVSEFSLLPSIVQISWMITVRRTGIQSGGPALVADQGSKLVKPKLVQITVKEGRK